MMIRRLLAVFLCPLISLQNVTAATGSSIVPDGKTQTTVTVNGKVTGVTTQTIRGVNAYNSFTTFNVAFGNTANLYLPTGTTNLLNLVNGSAVTVNGILNAIKNGQIGGHTFFIDPFGMVIGQKGVVNVGALTVITPTKDFMNSFFDASGNVSDSSTAAVVSGSVPLSSDGLISVRGRINAIGDVSLAGGDVINSGTIGTGAVFVVKQPDFSDVVNIKGLATGSQVSVANGNIEIVAANNFENSGTIDARGSSGVDGGTVNIQAGNNVALDSGSLIDASGVGQNSNGGTIKVYAGNDALFSAGGVLAVSGGNVSGNGGSIELSANGTVTLAGGDFKAGASNGTAGSVLVDPTETDITKSFSTYGGDYTNAGDTLYVYPGVTISTVPRGGGAAGNITLTTLQSSGATTQLIDIGGCGTASPCTTGPTVLNAGTTGDVTITATSNVNKTWSAAQPDANFNLDQATASVIVEPNATIIGNNVSITATATTNKIATITASANSSQNTAPDALCIILGGSGSCGSNTSPLAVTDSLLNLVGLDNYAGGILSKATATVQVGGTIIAAGKVTLDAEASSTANFTANGLYFTYAESDPTATAQVLPGASITAGGDFSLTAHSVNNLTNIGSAVSGQSNDNNTVTESGPAVAVTYSAATSISTAGIESGASVSAANVGVTAKNENSFDTEATPSMNGQTSSTQQYGAGVGVAVSNTSSFADAHLNGTVTATGAISSDAESVNSKNEVSATAVVGANSTDASSGNGDKVQSTTAKEAEQDSSGNSDTRAQINDLDLGAAVAIAQSSNTASSTVGPNAVITANSVPGQNVTITANASDTFKADASGSVASSNLSIGGAVAVTNYTNSATASIGQSANVTASGQVAVTATAELPNGSATQLEKVESFLEDFSLTGAASDLANDVSSASSSLSNAKTAIEGIEQAYDSAKDDTTTSLSSTVNSGTSGVGVAGVVNILTANNTATAFVGQGATVKANSASVTATATTESVNSAGTSNAQDSSDSAQKTQNPSSNSSNPLAAAGGTYSGLTYNNAATAYIDSGAVVSTTPTAGGDVNVTASATNFMANLYASGGKTNSDIGLNGAVSNVAINSTSTAYINDQATVNSAGKVTVDAENNTRIYQLGDNSTSAQNLAVGVVLGFVNVDNNTTAYVGNNASINANGNVTVEANAYERLMAASVSSVTASNSSTSSGASGTSDKPSSGETSGANNTADTNPTTDSSSYSSGIGLSGEIAFNNIKDTTKGYVGSGTTVTSAATSVSAKDTSLMLAADGGLVRASTAGVQGAFADDSISKTTEAYTDGATLNTGSLTVNATESDLVLAGAAGGAGSQGSSSVATLAGSVNYLSIANTTEASLANTTVLGQNGVGSRTGAVAVTASNQETVFSVAGSFTYGKSDLGVGVALDLGTINNTVKATVDSNSTIASNGTVGVTASDNENQLSVVADLAVGASNDVAASGSYQSVTKDVEAAINGTVSADAGVTVAAQDDQGGSSYGLPTGLIAIAGSLPVASGTAGLGASATISTTDKTVSASIGDNAQVTSSNGDVTVQALTSDNLNLFAGGGAYGETAGFMGSAVVNTINNTTDASIGKATVSGNNVNVTAKDTLNIIDGAGGISGSSSAAIGAAGDVELVGTTVGAAIGAGAVVTAANGNVDVAATQNQTVYSVAADAGVAGDATIIGSGTVLTYTTNTTATSAGNVTASGNFTVAGDRETEITSVAGEAALGGSAGVGVSFSVIDKTDTVTASVTGGTDNVAGTLGISATGNDTLYPAAAGGSISSSVSVAGSNVVNILNPTTDAYISGATINPSTNANASQTVSVRANSDTDIPFSLAGPLSVGGDAGLGEGAFVTAIDKQTTAEVMAGSNVFSAGNILVAAQSSETATSIAAALGAGEYAGVAGGVSVYNLGTTTTATVDSGATLKANNNVGVNSQDVTIVDAVVGDVTFGAVGVGAALAVVDVTKNTTASVDGQVTALGQGTPLTVDDGTFTISYASFGSGKSSYSPFGPDPAPSSGTGAFLTDPMLTGERRATANTTQVSGLAVTSTSTNDFNTLAAGASLGVEAASASGSVLMLTNNTTAEIKNANINSSGSSGDGVYVAAGTDVGHLGSAISVGIGGQAAVPAADVSILTNTTTADITGTNVSANGNVNVSANATVDDLSLSAGLGASQATTVAGSASYVGVTDITTAYVSGQTVGSASAPVASLTVRASDTTNTDLMVGSVAFGQTAGIGAAIAVTNISKNTQAYIDNSTSTYASGATSVTATSSEQIDAAAVAGAAGGFAGAAAGISVELDLSNTSASVGSGTDSAGSMTVTASNTVNNTSFDGSLGLGILAGAAGAVDVGQIENYTSAQIVGANVTTTTGDVSVGASETRDLESLAVGGAGAAGIGIEASVIDWSVDGNVNTTGAGNDTSSNPLSVSSYSSSTSSSTGTASGEADSQLQTSLGTMKNLLVSNNTSASQAASGSSSALGSAASSSDTPVYSALSTAPTTVGTTALISGGSVQSAGAVTVNASDTTTLGMTAGGAALGTYGIGAAVAIGEVNTEADAGIVGDATISAAKAVTVSASRDNSVSAKTLDGDGGEVFGGGASVAWVVDNGSTTAEVAATINDATNLKVSATTSRQDSASSGDIAVGAVAAGYAYSDVTENGSTTAELDANTQTAAQVQGVQVTASDYSAATSQTKAIGAGIVAVGGAEAYTTIDPTVDAHIAANTNIQTIQNTPGAGDVSVLAFNTADAYSNVLGASAGLATVGSSIAQAVSDPTIDAYIEGTVNAGGSVVVAARYNYNSNDNPVTTCPKPGTLGCANVEADSTMSSGSLINVGFGDKADASSIATVSGYVDGNANITAGGKVSIYSESGSSVSSDAGGTTLAVIDVPGNTEASATITNNNSAYVNNATVTASNFLMSAQSTDNDRGATAIGSAYGLAAVPTATASAYVTGTTEAHLAGTGTITASNGDVTIQAQVAEQAAASAQTQTVAGISEANVTASVGSPNQGGSVDTPVVTTDSGTNIVANTATLQANLSQAAFSAYAYSKTMSADSDSYATTNVNVNGSPAVEVSGNITAPSELSMVATVNSDSNQVFANGTAKADIDAGVTGSLYATANDYAEFSPTVNVADSSTLTTQQLNVAATAPISNASTNPYYSNNADAKANTVVYWTLETVQTTVDEVFGWIPFFGSLIEKVTKWVTEEVEHTLNSDVSTVTNGTYKSNPSINLNHSTIVQSGGVDPNITIAADGTITSNEPAGTVTTASGEVVVNDLANQTGSITLNTPGGTVSGSPTVHSDSLWDTVTITNSSNMNLQVNSIEPSNSSSNPAVNVTANTDNLQLNYVLDKTSSSINITNNSATANTNVYLNGNIDDAGGSVSITAARGSILGTSSSEITATNVDLTANHGSIGSSSTPLNLNLETIEATSQTASLSALAGHDLYLTVNPVEYFQTGETIPSSVPVNLNSLEAGDNIGLTLNAATAYGPQLVTETLFAGTPYAFDFSYYVNGANTVTGKYNLTGDIAAGGNVTLNLPAQSNLNMQSGSTIISGFENIGYTVNADGSWSSMPIPVNYSDTIGGGQVVMQDMQQQGGSVTIAGVGTGVGTSTGTLTGTGTINVLNGYSNVTIANNSNNNLVIGNLNYDTPVTGKISIFGAAQSLNGGSYSGSNIALTETNNPTSTITLNQNGSGNVQLTGGIRNQAGNTVIDTSNSIVNTGGTAQLVESNSINLDAPNGQIGTVATPINIQVNNGAVNGHADGDIALDQTAGNLNAGSITSATGDVYLTSDGSILNGTGASDLVSGRDIVLTAKTGTIGSISNSLQVSSGEVTAVAAQDVDIAAVTGDLNPVSVISQSGNVNLAAAGNVNLGTVTAASGDVTLTASGSILNADRRSAANITAKAVTLTATNGSIGTTANAVNLDSSSGTVLTATAKKDVDVTAVAGNLNANSVTSNTGNVNLTVAAGNLNAGTITSVTGAVDLTASGSILNGTGASELVSGKYIVLNAKSGTIGSGSSPLQVNSEAVTAVAPQDVDIATVTGDLNATSVTSQNGNVNLEADDGSVNLGTVNATEGHVTVTASNSILNADQRSTANITAKDVTLTATNGSIGTTADTVNLDSSSGTVLTATAKEDVDVTAVAGNLNANSVTSSAGNVNLTVVAGNLNVGAVTSVTGTVDLTASDSILNGTGANELVSGKNIVLNAKTGTIGSSSSPLQVNSGAVTAVAAQDVDIATVTGDLNATSVTSQNGNVNLEADDGSVNLGTVTATEGDVTVTASNSILNADQRSTANIAAKDVTLTATNGSIGSTSGPVVTQANGIVNASAGSNIFLTQLGTLYSQTLLSRTGSINVTVQNGNGYLQSVIAPQSVFILVNGALLNIGLVKSRDISVDVTQKNGAANLDYVLVGRTLDIIADHPHLSHVIPITRGPISFGIYTTEGGFNLGPIDPGTVLTNHQDSERYRELRKRVTAEHELTQTEDTVVDRTSQSKASGAAQ